MLVLCPQFGAVLDGAGGEPVAVADAPDAFAEGVFVGAAEVNAVLEGFPVAGGEVGKFASHI